MPDPAMQVDALPRLRKKRAWHGIGAAADDHQIRVRRQRHEGLAAEWMAFERAHRERHLTRLRTKDADHRGTAVVLVIDMRQRVDTLRGAVVDGDDCCRAVGVDDLAKWRTQIG